ncbi:MAG: hypothetical protein Q8P33_00675, partial [bacterium]|nr:hypothetical protein [bacterium]
ADSPLHRGRVIMLADKRKSAQAMGPQGSALLTVRADERGRHTLQLSDPPRGMPVCREGMSGLLLSAVRLPVDQDSGFALLEDNPLFSVRSLASKGQDLSQVVYLLVTDLTRRVVIKGIGPLYGANAARKLVIGQDIVWVEPGEAEITEYR